MHNKTEFRIAELWNELLPNLYSFTIIIERYEVIIPKSKISKHNYLKAITKGI